MHGFLGFGVTNIVQDFVKLIFHIFTLIARRDFKNLCVDLTFSSLNLNTFQFLFFPLKTFFQYGARETPVSREIWRDDVISCYQTQQMGWQV